MDEVSVEFEDYFHMEKPANAVLGVWRSSRGFSKLVDRRIDAILAETKLTARTFEFLHWADRIALEHRSLETVRRNSGFSASEATRLIKSLKDAKYLQTSPRAGDRRFLQLQVTPLGRKIIRRSFRAVMADLGQFILFEPLCGKICEGIKTFQKEIMARDLYFDQHISVVDANAEDISPTT